MTPRYVTVEKAQRIATVTLNRTEALNALSRVMMGQLAAAF
jgi:enoyl-CoA hydratase/carnithine racemase